MNIFRLLLLIVFLQHFPGIALSQTNSLDVKTIGLFSCGAAAGLLISLFHRHWVVSKVDEINIGNADESFSFPDSTLWSPLSFNQIDVRIAQLPFNKSLKETAQGDTFSYSEMSSRIHLPTLMLTQHTLTNEYLVKKNLWRRKSAQKNKTTFHTADLGSNYPYIFGTVLITFGMGYALTFLNKK